MESVAKLADECAISFPCHTLPGRADGRGLSGRGNRKVMQVRILPLSTRATVSTGDGAHGEPDNTHYHTLPHLGRRLRVTGRKFQSCHPLQTGRRTLVIATHRFRATGRGPAGISRSRHRDRSQRSRFLQVAPTCLSDKFHLAGLPRPFGPHRLPRLPTFVGRSELFWTALKDRFDSVARLRDLCRSRLVFGTRCVRSPTLPDPSPLIAPGVTCSNGS